MSNKMLDKTLLFLDFKTESSASGLLFTNKNYSKDTDVPFDEILILHSAQSLGANAVYFRRVEGRGSIPQLFIFDNSDSHISPEKLTDIHIKLWSSGIVPLYYVFDDTEIRIFNCRKPVEKSKSKLTAKHFDVLKISKVHTEYKKYSAKLFENGSFWESQENKDRFKADSSSYNKLISGLQKIRTDFVKENQNEAICNKLLVLSILVKYLEERKDSKGNHVLPKGYFEKYDGSTCFCDILRKKKCISFFKALGSDVNGKIFELTEQEKTEIEKIDQPGLAEFLDAKKDNNQFVFWKLYDFNYLPVELISRIYEEFVPKRSDITYTPAHLVSFMVDECMPISTPQDSFKLIDVSCGSGIFLVAAFKRMVQWWQKKQYEKTGEIQSPKIKQLKSILANSIYGVDLEGEAAKLTIFSLTVALCDMLDPTIMWNDLTTEKLGDLSGNIVAQDFFDFIKPNKKFHLVIGNPPFNLPFKRKEDKDKYWNDLAKKVEFDFEIPQKKIALLFLQQAMKLLEKGGVLSLVMPSGSLLYNETLAYRREFMDRYNVPQIFDFSCLSARAVLFEKTVSTSVIFAQNTTPDDKDILHVAVRRTKAAKEKLYFEIDKYDLYYVPKELAKTEPLIWKTNLLGGGHLFYLLKRMQSLRTLGKYLENKKKNHRWFYGEGYKPIGKATKNPKKALYLTGKRLIPTGKFTSDHIKEHDIIIETEKLFDRERKKNKLIFKSPHILIKERPSLPVAAAFERDDLIFRREIIGIHTPETCKNELLELRENIISNRKLYKVLLLSRSGRAGISRSTATINQKDILALPYPEKKDSLKLSKAEQIICDDVLNYGIQQLSQGEGAKVNTEQAKKRTIEAFAEVFCTSLNSIYKEEPKQFYPLEHIESLSFICLPFAYGNPGKPKKISNTMTTQIEKGNLDSLIDNTQGTNLLYRRIIKLYHQKDMVYLIKPKTLRYWLKSIALRDANEVFTDLVGSGY
jgi:hypothetical protein